MRRLGLATVVLALAVTTACGGDDEPQDRTTPTASSPTGGPPVTPTDPATDTPAGSPTAASTVPAATGTALTGPSTSVQVPADWKGTFVPDGDYGGSFSRDGADGRYAVRLSDNEADTETATLDQMVKFALRSSVTSPPLERQPDLTVVGFPAFHLAGRDDVLGTFDDQVGFHSPGRDISIIVSTPLDLDPTARAALVDSILASVQLTAD